MRLSPQRNGGQHCCLQRMAPPIQHKGGLLELES